MDATTHTTPGPAEPAGPGGGRHATPASRPGASKAFFHRLSESTWAPVAAKALAILAGMLALAAIGAAAMARGPGVPVAAAAPTPSASAAGWIAPVASATGAPRAAASTEALSPPSAPAGRTDNGKIILNRAGAEDLMKLPRVGAKRAHEILELRARIGKFRRPTDLLRVKGIGRKTLQHMLPLLVVDPPAERPKSEGASPPPAR